MLEIAGILTRNGIYTYFPLVDTGSDLLAANRDASIVLPVQVKYRKKGLNLDLNRTRDFNRFNNANTIIAFIIGTPEQRIWFLPFQDWQSKAVDNKRRDNLLFLPIFQNEDWLKGYLGDAGVRRVFERLLSGN